MSETPGRTMRFIIKDTTAPTKNGRVVVRPFSDYRGENAPPRKKIPVWAAHGELYRPDGRLALAAGGVLVPAQTNPEMPEAFYPNHALTQAERDRRTGGVLGEGVQPNVLAVTVSKFNHYIARGEARVSPGYSELHVPIDMSQDPLVIARNSLVAVHQHLSMLEANRPAAAA